MSLLNNVWEDCSQQVFWGEIAPNSHVVQFYENNDLFLSMLEGFIVDGFKAGDGVIIIATAEHLLNLYNRLSKKGFDINELRDKDLYIPIQSDTALSKFMINGWPDEKLFQAMASELLSRANQGNRKVRAFGEMVATLWGQGNCGATVHLEHLWDNFNQSNEICLYCAYPKSGFTQASDISMNNICCSHSLMIREGSDKSRISYMKASEAIPVEDDNLSPL